MTESSILIGMAGSNMMNCVFSRDGTEVVEIVNQYDGTNQRQLYPALSYVTAHFLYQSAEFALFPAGTPDTYKDKVALRRESVNIIDMGPVIEVITTILSRGLNLELLLSHTEVNI